MVFVLVPDDSTADCRHSIQAARRACRVAHLLGFLPFSPLLHYATYLSPGELTQQRSKLHWQWLRRCDRIWLQFPGGDGDDRIDSVVFDILDKNGKLGVRSNNCEGRRPVYQLHQTGDESVGYVPVAMSRSDVRQLLNINLSVGLMRGCM